MPTTTVERSSNTQTRTSLFDNTTLVLIHIGSLILWMGSRGVYRLLDPRVSHEEPESYEKTEIISSASC